MRKAFLLLLLIVAFVLSIVGADRALRTDLSEEIVATFEPNDILTPIEIKQATPSELALASVYGRIAFEAEHNYPTTARLLYESYGHLPEFQEIVRLYGFIETFPIIAAQVDNADAMLRAEHRASHVLGVLQQSIRQWRLPEKAEFAPAELTPQLRGLYVIDNIADRGHAYLAEWVVVFKDDGTVIVRRNWTQTVAETGIRLTLNNVRMLEHRLARGEATVSDKAWAAIDVALLVVGASTVASTIRRSATFAKGAATTARVGRTMHAVKTTAAVTRAALPTWAVKAGKAALVVGGVYAVYKNPMLVPSGIKTVAELIGISQAYLYLAVFVVLFILIAPAFTLVGYLITTLRFMRFVVWLFVHPLVKLGSFIERRVQIASQKA